MWCVLKKKRTILVTGDCGFIGKVVCKAFSDHDDVIGVDVLESSGDKGYNHIVADILDQSSLREICIKYQPSIIIHCAGIAHQTFNKSKKETYFKVNCDATKTLADIAFGANPDVHFIYLSTVTVYGELPDGTPFRETDKCHPSSDYAYSKLEAEKRLFNFYDSGDLKKIDILRLSPVYDSQLSLNLDRRVFALKKMAYIRFGKGEQKMTAVSRQNLTDFIEFLVNQRERFAERYCNIYNVCDEQSYTFNTIIETFKRSPYHPDRFVLNVPLPLVWLATRMAGLVFKGKRQWLHSCYDKLAKDLVFDNRRMLATGFRPKQTLESVFLRKSEGPEV